MIQATNGNFYGVSDGLPRVGTFNEDIFQFTPAGEFTVQFKSPIDDTGISGLTQGANGNLYGAFENIPAGEINFLEVSTEGTGFVAFAPFTALACTASQRPAFGLNQGRARPDRPVRRLPGRSRLRSAR
jgi:hypothetical protein